ncbi:MAG: glycogen debranching protein GlgX [Acidimicrobiia bacterium]
MNRPGVHLNDDGIEVVVSAPDAERVELCLFDHEGSERRLPLEATGEGEHRGVVAGIGPGQHYGLRAHGSWDPGRGLLHDPAKLLLDPFAAAVAGEYVEDPAVHPETHGIDTAPWVPRSVVTQPPPRPRPGPEIPWSDTVIYETHVRGLTMNHPGVEPDLRGTYLGAGSPAVIEHLQKLGVTTVELMPVAHHVTEAFLQKKSLTNYWGYSTLAWFAPHAAYATGDDGRQVAEFAAMVDQLHAGGIEVILDVVFNHTAEGGASGPILSMKGLDNRGWYRLTAEHDYIDWTGTGNTVATDQARVRSAIVNALRWWSESLGVDGFRFDLGVILGRAADGVFDPSHLKWLTDDDVVGATKLIAEPWDLGPNGYRVGEFGEGWVEWNSRFRDDIRDFWRRAGSIDGLATRMSGSPDLFENRGSTGAVNFLTAHDGFTLADLVAYDHKHNDANGEQNRDGHTDNRSWNSGVEGPTDAPAILEVRRRRSAGLLTTLLLSAGIPMLLGGDELGRSQSGNNNAYATDDASAWYDWNAAPFADLIGRATAFRRDNPMLNSGRRDWADLDGSHIDTWGAPGPVRMETDGLVVAFNPTPDDLGVVLPEGTWTLSLDSSDLAATGNFVTDAPLPAWTVRVFAG